MKFMGIWDNRVEPDEMGQAVRNKGIVRILYIGETDRGRSVERIKSCKSVERGRTKIYGLCSLKV